MYGRLIDLVWWFLNGILYVINDPRQFFIEDGWLFIIVVLVVFFGLLFLMVNWFTKFWPFNVIRLMPPGEENRGRELGRKLIYANEGSILFNALMPKNANKEKVAAVILYYSSESKISKLLVLKNGNEEPTCNYKFKGRNVDLIVYRRGIKYNDELSCKVASNRPKTVEEVTDEKFFYDRTKKKLERMDEYAEIGVRANAETQFKQIDMSSIPIVEPSKKGTKKDAEAMALYTQKKKDDDEDDEDKIVEGMKKDEILAELEGTMNV